METIAWLIALWIGYMILRGIFRQATSSSTLPSAPTADAPAIRSADYFGPLELRLGKERLGQAKDGREVEVLEARGILPLANDGDVIAVTSILDITENNSPKPVLASIDGFQEPDSACFQYRQPLGRLSPGAGTRTWVTLAMVPKEILVPPKRGRRRLAIVLRLFDDDLGVDVEYGFADGDDPALLGTKVFEVTQEFQDAGYEDAREANARIGDLAVKLAVAIAAADGEVADAEGFRIREWMQRRVASGGGDENETKRRLNGAFMDACEAARAGRLAISDITREMNAIGSMPQKWSCVDLCFEIIAAHGVARPEELDLVRRIAKSLGVPPEELEALHDSKLVGVRTELGQTNSIDAVLGLDPSWEKERAQRHLREQFQKWNNRLAALREGDERDNAQRMLDLIAEARKRYV